MECAVELIADDDRSDRHGNNVSNNAAERQKCEKNQRYRDGLAVRITKKKTRVMIFMDNCNAQDFCADNVWRTEELLGKVKDIGGGDFKVELPSGFHELTKNHEPDKEEPLTEGISVGDLVYSEQVSM